MKKEREWERVPLSALRLLRYGRQVFIPLVGEMRFVTSETCNRIRVESGPCITEHGHAVRWKSAFTPVRFPESGFSRNAVILLTL